MQTLETTVGIIGTAGRNSAGPKMSKDLYFKMYDRLVQEINNIRQENPNHKIKAISGAAAWSDHLAVSLYLRDNCEALKLFFPAPFEPALNRFSGKGPFSVAASANRYHQSFSEKMGGSSMKAISLALAKGAESQTSNGFKARNLLVGQVDYLIAFTWGQDMVHCSMGELEWQKASFASIPAGGTSHTWNCSKAYTKIHISLPQIK